MGEELCPTGWAVTQPASVLLHGDAVFLHEQCRKFLEGGGLVQHSVDLLSQLFQFRLVNGLGGLLPFGGKLGVGMVEAALSAPLRPILALRNMVALGFQQIDLVQVGLLAHLHDSDTEVPEHGRGAAVLLARFPVARLVHEGLPFHGADTQAADDDVDVDVSRTVVTVRVGAEKNISLRLAIRQAIANEDSPHSTVSSRYESRSLGLPFSSRMGRPVYSLC